MTHLTRRSSLGDMLEVVVGLAILLFAVFFPSATAFIILGIAVLLTIPDARKRLRQHRRR